MSFPFHLRALNMSRALMTASYFASTGRVLSRGDPFSLMTFFFFFFSSRRRHTRSLCDWSSRRVLFRSNLCVIRGLSLVARWHAQIRVRGYLAPAHESVHATARRAKDRGLHKVWLARIDHHARRLRRGGRKVPPSGFRLDGARVSIRRFHRQDFRDAPQGLRRSLVFGCWLQFVVCRDGLRGRPFFFCQNLEERKNPPIENRRVRAEGKPANQSLSACW